jgi:hypothetical protein
MTDQSQEKMEELPQSTLEGDKAKAWCHACIPVHACKSIDALQEHMRRVHGKK